MVASSCPGQRRGAPEWVSVESGTQTTASPHPRPAPAACTHLGE